jgi:hypothetical protein
MGQGVFDRQSGSNEDSPFNITAPFSQDEFPALGGMSDGQRQGLAQHLAGQSNGVYDPRQQGGGQVMTPPPNLGGSQSLQQAQDHRASMLEALQQGQRVPPRTGVSPNIMSGSSMYSMLLICQVRLSKIIAVLCKVFKVMIKRYVN